MSKLIRLVRVFLVVGVVAGFLLFLCGVGQLFGGKIPYFSILGIFLFVTCWFFFDMISRKEK